MLNDSYIVKASWIEKENVSNVDIKKRINELRRAYNGHAFEKRVHETVEEIF